jgi:hypothetical protein
MIQSQIVLHRFAVVMSCGLGSLTAAGPLQGRPSSVRVPARTSDVTISRTVHNCLEVLQEDRLVYYFQYY